MSKPKFNSKNFHFREGTLAAALHAAGACDAPKTYFREAVAECNGRPINVAASGTPGAFGREKQCAAA